MITFSVIIPMFNEIANINYCIHSIIKACQGKDNVEFIIADNGSTDGCIEAAEALGVKVMRFQGETIAGLRNKAAAAAKGDYLLFIDSDIMVPDNWFRQIQDNFDKDYTDVFAFVDIAPEGAPWYAKRWAERVLARRDTTRQTDYLPGRNINIRAEWFKKVDGFDEALETGEDKDFIARLAKAGARIYTVYQPLLTHYGYEKTFIEWVKKEYWRQHNHPSLCRRHGFTFRYIRFPSVALWHVLMAIIFLLASFSTPLSYVVLSIFAWFAPAVFFTIRKSCFRRNINIVIQFVALHWLRFHIAGWSILVALLEEKR